MDKLAYTVKEAAQAVGVSDRKMRDLINITGFPVVRLGGRILIPIDPLRDWLKRKAENGEVVH